MNALADLQRQFAAGVLDPVSAGAFTEAVVGTNSAGAAERVGVYRHAYRARLVEALGKDYPCLKALTGDAFPLLAHDYVAMTPSHHFNMRWYGEGLASFLETTSPWSDTPGFAEMAHLEWTIGLSFDARDEPHVDVDEVERILPAQWPGMRLQLGAAVRRINLRWNVAEIHRAMGNQKSFPELRDLNVHTWIVSRQDTVVHYRQLDADEAAALEAAAHGAAFADLCDILCGWHDVTAVALRAATLFKAWVRNEWVTQLQLND